MKAGNQFKVRVQSDAIVEGERIVSVEISMPTRALPVAEALSSIGSYPTFPKYLKQSFIASLLEYEEGAKDLARTMAGPPKARRARKSAPNLDQGKQQ